MIYILGADKGRIKASTPIRLCALCFRGGLVEEEKTRTSNTCKLYLSRLGLKVAVSCDESCQHNWRVGGDGRAIGSRGYWLRIKIQ